MFALTSRFQDGRQRSLLLMQDREAWVTWPFLPLVRQGPDGARQLGVLYDAQHTSGRFGYSSTVFLQNLFALPLTESRLFAGPKIVYDSFDELLDAGWLVD